MYLAWFGLLYDGNFRLSGLHRTNHMLGYNVSIILLWKCYKFEYIYSWFH